MEEDPAAAFLAREQDELADIAEDTLGFTSSEVTAVSVFEKVEVPNLSLLHLVLIVATTNTGTTNDRLLGR